jgi:hypothetical protein
MVNCKIFYLHSKLNVTHISAEQFTNTFNINQKHAMIQPLVELLVIILSNPATVFLILKAYVLHAIISARPVRMVLIVPNVHQTELYQQVRYAYVEINHTMMINLQDNVYHALTQIFVKHA